MSISLFNAIPAGAIEVLSDANDAPHFKRADLGRFLGIVDVKTSMRNVNVVTKSRSEIAAEGEHTMLSLGKSKNSHDVFVDLEAALAIVVRSRKPKAVELVRWLTRKGVQKITEKHQKVIDEKDMQIALLDDDLAGSQEHARQLGFNNTGMQGEIRAKDQQIDHLQQQYIPLLEDEGKKYGITIIAKNDESVGYPFISICGQHGYRRQKKRVVLLKNPGSTEFADGSTPNAIVTYNMWREHGLIETDPARQRDFRLVNIKNEQLLRIV